MTNSKTTKRALLLSVLSVLMCVAMLTGSTFAWFTDSVESGKNKIVAGNLDVELLHTNGHVTDEKVSPTTPLFVDENGDPIKWEPGVMVYENFTVKNVGTLALKFNMTLNASFNTVTVDGKEKSLKDVLKVKILKDEVFSGERDDLVNLVKGSKTKIDAFSEENVKLEAGTSKEYAIVVYWEPTDHDNDYNLNNGRKADDGTDQLYVDLGVTLVATQVPHEKDSFGDDYDEKAVYPAVPNPIDTEGEVNITVAEGGTLTDTASGTSITVPALAVDADTNATFSMKMSESTSDSVTYDISLKKDDQPITLAQAATVTANIGKNLKDVKVYHSGKAMKSSDYSYDSTTGILTITTKSFSPFKVTFKQIVAVSVNGVAHPSFEEALKAASNGDTVVLLDDVTVGSDVTMKYSTTLDLSGHSMIFDAATDANANAAALIPSGGRANVTIEGDGIIDTTNRGNYCISVHGPSGLGTATLTINGGTFKGCATAVQAEAKSKITINGGFFQCTPDNNGSYEFTLNCIDAAYKAGTAKIIVKGGTFVNFNPADNQAEGEHTNFVAEGYEVVPENHGNDVWYTVVPKA